MPLRFATYNVHACVGADRACDPARIAAVLAEIDADVVGLQEVSARGDALGDQFAYLERATGMTAVAGPNIVRPQARFGNVLLTRRPLLDARLVDLSVAPYEPRGAVVADIDADRGRRVRVVVTHLGLRVWERARQHARLGEIIAARGEIPVVILGDFNSWWPDLKVLRHIGPRLAWRKTPASFPAHLPVLALDRIRAVPDTVVGRVRTHGSRLARQASDHLPVVADIMLRRAGAASEEEIAPSSPARARMIRR